MTHNQDRIFETVMEQLIQNGVGDFRPLIEQLYNLAMRLEREEFLQAPHYGRCAERRGYANGFKNKHVDSPSGTLKLEVPKTRNTDVPFYPQSLERGRRSHRAVLLAVAEMYIKGVSTRQAEDVMRTFGIESLSSSQVSRATALLDKELTAWRERPLGIMRYLILDARYEKARVDNIVRDVAVLSAVGVAEDGRRHVLGVWVALSEAEVHWRAFLESLLARGLRGVEYIVSDDHAGLQAARRAVFGAATWQRCQFHLAQNAVNHAPNRDIRARIGRELRSVWNSETLVKAEAELSEITAKYQEKHPKFANWLAENIPQGLAVFSLPKSHHKRMRTSNGIERPIQQELKRRTKSVRVFPNEAALLRLTTAILVEIDEKWQTDNRQYIKWSKHEES